MFQYLKKQLRTLQLMKLNEKDDQKEKNEPRTELSRDLKQNLDSIQKILGSSYDVILREICFGNQGEIKGALIFLKGITDKTIINESILKPLMYENEKLDKLETGSFTLNTLQTGILSAHEVEVVTTIETVIEGCLSGDTLLLIDGLTEALRMNTSGGESRGIEEPKTETVIRGSREAFTESLVTNTALLRRIIRNPNLTLDTMIIGRQTKTTVCIAYIKGIANPQIIEEIKRRLKRIKTDAILESGYIEQFIEDAPFSIFSTVGNGEKPDKVSAKLLEGRVAILVNGTPFVLTIPMVLLESFQTQEDYYSRPYYASLIRLIRLAAYLTSTLAPAFYVALSTFHQELIPTPLLFTMAAAEEGVPFPAVVEAFTLGLIFEILREAGVRLPRPVGQAISIVGALVLGETAVRAGLVGEPIVIVIALTAVADFVAPAQTDSSIVLRFMFVILAGTLGIFGIILGLLGTFIHLASLRSFGIPYFSPYAPLSVQDLKDTLIRFPLWTMITRPRLIGWNDPQREAFRLKPTPPSEDSSTSTPNSNKTTK